MKQLLAAALLFTFAAPLHADEAEDLKAVHGIVKTSVNKIMKILLDKDIGKEDRRKQVEKISDPLFDFALMAKLTLGRKHWPSFSKEERKAFTKLFIAQLKDSYFEKVDLLTDEVVEFETPVRKKSKVHMLTHIVSKDQRYEMLYKLYKKKGKWLVYDVEIEGISVVKSYGSQYDQFLSDKKPADLLSKMREKAFGIPKEIAEQGKSKKKDS
jgi:phospholipid transport system substrate-binding protein